MVQLNTEFFFFLISNYLLEIMVKDYLDDKLLINSEVPNGNEETARVLAMPEMQMKFDLLQRDRSGPRVVTTSEFKENECEN